MALTVYQKGKTQNTNPSPIDPKMEQAFNNLEKFFAFNKHGYYSQLAMADIAGIIIKSTRENDTKSLDSIEATLKDYIQKKEEKRIALIKSVRDFGLKDFGENDSEFIPDKMLMTEIRMVSDLANIISSKIKNRSVEQKENGTLEALCNDLPKAENKEEFEKMVGSIKDHFANVLIGVALGNIDKERMVKVESSLANASGNLWNIATAGCGVMDKTEPPGKKEKLAFSHTASRMQRVVFYFILYLEIAICS